MNENLYIKQLKRLIKKYHPDLCNDDFLKTKYNEITKILVNKLNKIKSNENADIHIEKNNGLVREPDGSLTSLAFFRAKALQKCDFYKKLFDKLKLSNNSNNQYGIIKVRQQDYAYYKLGIKYYRNIHPNQFYKRNHDTTFETKTCDELVSVLNNIYLSFRLSEYYFKKIIAEHSQSPYCEDAKAKIKLLYRLSKSYENIIVEGSKIINSEKYIDEMGLKIL